MNPSAPYMEKCVSCENPIVFTDKDIEIAKNTYGDVRESQEFLTAYKTPNSVINECFSCQRLKWRVVKSEIKKKQQTQEEFLGEKNKHWFIHWWNRNYKSTIIYILMFLLGTCLAYYWPSPSTENHPVFSRDELQLAVTRLRDQFPSLQPSILKKIGGAFSRLKTPGEPFVFLFLHDDTNKQNTDCLASYTSIVAKQNIFTNTSKSLWMNASEWTQYSGQDELLNNKLMTPLEENEVLILENLQDLPWSLAKCFHHLCDSENPLIPKAMIILELKVDGVSFQRLTEGEKFGVAELAMKMAWPEATNSYRAALITRMTSFVDAIVTKLDADCSSVSPLKSEESFIKISP